MPYKIEDFQRLGLYSERADGQECDLSGGRVLRNLNVSDKIRDLLNNLEPESHGGDKSRQDSAIITSMLSVGYKPADVYSTFMSSVRGTELEQRRPGHAEDYLKRTIEKALGFLSKDTGKADESVNVDFSKRRNGNNQSGLVISMANEVEVERINWVWKNYIPEGKLTILAGDPGMGKSTITADLLSRISRGTFMPSGERGVTGTSLIASAEDSAEDTMTPRLIACEANLSKIGFIREVRDDGLEGTRFLSFPKDLELIRSELRNRGIRILVIDPLNAFLEGGVDTYKDQDMRRVLHPLEDIAEESGTAILVVAHLTKKEETSTLYRVGGSIGFIGAARSVLAVSAMEDETRVLYSLKCNLSQRPPSLCYETRQVRKTRKANEWKGEERIEANSIRWLGEVEFNPQAKSTKKGGSANEEVSDFLRQILEDAGELPTEVIFSEARLAGISKSDLNKTKGSVGIKAAKKGETWFWQWPEGK